MTKRLFQIITLALVLPGTVSAQASEESFRKLCGEKAAAANAAKSMTVPGREGWMFLASELRHLSVGKFTGEAAQEVSLATKPEWRDPLAAIVDFEEGLERAGIELLMVPVPPKAVVYPDQLDDSLKAVRLDSVHQAFHRLLKEKGVAVLDLYPALAAARADGVYCKQDSHWSGLGCEIAAKQIGEALKEHAWLAEAKKSGYESEVRETEITGDLWTASKGDKPGKEKIPLRFVGSKNGGNLQPVSPDMASPVILLGDSHTLVFHAGEDMHARGAGLADQLALAFGFPIDLIGVRGSGATPARINLFRRIRGDADYLKNKKLVIWCFTAREFTEAVSGWRKVPVTQ